MSAPVVCIGCHVLDVLGRPVAEIPPGQGSVTLEEIRATAAGTAAGTSVDLARLGLAVRNFGAVGDDALGRLLLDLLAQEGVDTSLVVRKAGARTSATILPIRANGERPALHAPGADRLLEATDVTPAVLAAVGRAAAVHVGGPDALGHFAGAPLRALVAEAARNRALVTLDVLRPCDPMQLERLEPLLPLADWFLPNEVQLRNLTGEEDLARAIGRVQDLGVRGVGVTLGEEGCLVSYGDETLRLPALSVDVVDTTGCGDGFDAGFIAGLLAGLDHEQAAWLATACGALVATGLGSDAGLSGMDAALALLARDRPAVAAAITDRLEVSSRTVTSKQPVQLSSAQGAPQ